MQILVRTLLCLAFFVSLNFLEATESKRPTICLNMIVKNESKVITRCLTSMLPIIDYWVIVDTGSTDGTQKVIKDFMASKNVPGELHERPWKNFGHNRNEALQLAKGKGDYVFFIDADEYLVYEPGFKLPLLDKDFYFVNISHSGSKYARSLLINNHLNWKWVGVLHEVVCCPEAKTFATLENVYDMYTTEGARSKDPKKYEKDAEVLEAGLLEEPNNDRYVFYLAQSYKDAGNYEKALENYEKRVKMGGWDQEVFYALLKIGELKENLGRPDKEVIQSYNRAYQYRRSRLEPLYHLAHFYREKGDFKSGYNICKIAQTLPPSNDILFVQQWMYDYGIPLELSICAYYIGKYDECQQISLEILKKENIPEDIKECVQNNLGFANAKLLEQILEADDSENIEDTEKTEKQAA